MTESFEDIIGEFEFLPEFHPTSTRKSVEDRPTEEENNFDSLMLDEDESKIISVLKKGEASADSLAGETGISTGKLLSTLMKMEMKKLITQLPGKRFSLRNSK